MNKINVLDCTLREAPLTGLAWGDKNIRRIVRGLENTNIDIIECGFLKDGEHINGTTIYNKTEQIKKYITPKKKGTLYVALVDYGRYHLDQLEDYDGSSIDGIRICFKKNEKDKVIEFAQKIKDKGYKVFIQHVDTMGYTKNEIIEFVQNVNHLKPFAYAIVDTFGAMYAEDVRRIYDIIEKHLSKDILLGFHGHNNLLIAGANAEAFITYVKPERHVMIDASMLGCGRGAGNAHTELIIQFLNKKMDKEYSLDEMLDTIDYMSRWIEGRCSWGYSIPYFISGVYNAHVFNVQHLLKRHNIRSKDLRNIIENLNEVQKKKYDYTLLEKIYVEYFDNKVNEKKALIKLKGELKEREILLLAPGKTIISERERIDNFIKEYNPIIIGVNSNPNDYPLDYIFCSSPSRYQLLRQEKIEKVNFPELILTSNIKMQPDEKETLVNYLPLIKYGWINLDSSMILLLRLLARINRLELYIAGFDGYDANHFDFYDDELSYSVEKEEKLLLTKENEEMLKDYVKTTNATLHFLTKTLYQI